MPHDGAVADEKRYVVRSKSALSSLGLVLVSRTNERPCLDGPSTRMVVSRRSRSRNPGSRLALIILLDQFLPLIYREPAPPFAENEKAVALALQGNRCWSLRHAQERMGEDFLFPTHWSSSRCVACSSSGRNRAAMSESVAHSEDLTQQLAVNLQKSSLNKLQRW